MAHRFFYLNRGQRIAFAIVFFAVGGVFILHNTSSLSIFSEPSVAKQLPTTSLKNQMPLSAAIDSSKIMPQKKRVKQPQTPSRNPLNEAIPAITE